MHAIWEKIVMQYGKMGSPMAILTRHELVSNSYIDKKWVRLFFIVIIKEQSKKSYGSIEKENL